MINYSYYISPAVPNQETGLENSANLPYPSMDVPNYSEYSVQLARSAGRSTGREAMLEKERTCCNLLDEPVDGWIEHVPCFSSTVCSPCQPRPLLSTEERNDFRS
jgi:hypothetical protein